MSEGVEATMSEFEQAVRSAMLTSNDLKHTEVMKVIEEFRAMRGWKRGEVPSPILAKAIIDTEPGHSQRITDLLRIGLWEPARTGSRVPGTSNFEKHDWYFHAYNFSLGRWPSFLKRFARRLRQQNSKAAREHRRPYCKSNAKYQAWADLVKVDWDL